MILPLEFIYLTELVAALGRNIINSLAPVLVLPDGLRWITDRSILVLDNTRVDPSRVARFWDRACSRTTAGYKGNSNNQYFSNFQDFIPSLEFKRDIDYAFSSNLLMPLQELFNPIQHYFPILTGMVGFFLSSVIVLCNG